MDSSKCLFRIWNMVLAVLLVASSMPTSLTLTARAAVTILRVTPTGKISSCGDTWANACTLQAALGAAVSGDEIWVAAGTYRPGASGERTATFQLKSGVGVYGGFAGNETDRADRDWKTNVTILSGDLNSNGRDNNDSYQVVTGANNAVLDGFTITLGYGNDSSYPKNSGGGMYNENSSPVVTNVSFSGNWAVFGGGMYNTNSSPVVTNVTFSGNSGLYGGGMYNENSSPVVTNVTFSGNSTYGGGGIYNSGGSPVLTNVTFSGNTATYGGGLNNADSSAVVTNATFSGNEASFDGGGIFTRTYDPTSPLVVRNSILWGNTGGEIFEDGLGSPTVSYSIVQGGYDGTANQNVDPLLAPLGSYGGGMQTHALLPGSPAIDAASSSFCPATDQRGVLRDSSACDLGAFESQGFTLSIAGGNNQSALLNIAFSRSLSVLVTANAAGEPVDGGRVTFSAPLTGASATLTGSPATITSGVASVSAVANPFPGSYAVASQAAGATGVDFSLTNVTGLKLYLPLGMK